LTECLNCKKRYRLDNLIHEESFSLFIKNEKKDDCGNLLSGIKCLNCENSNFTNPHKFNLLLSTRLGAIENKSSEAYLRPETCQGIFVNFLYIQKSSRLKLPFGIGQIGKSFRNEITLNHGIFRTREFEQMEMEFFCKEEDSER
jgi:glycyl-tRNA synthetase